MERVRIAALLGVLFSSCSDEIRHEIHAGDHIVVELSLLEPEADYHVLGVEGDILTVERVKYYGLTNDFLISESEGTQKIINLSAPDAPRIVNVDCRPHAMQPPSLLYFDSEKYLGATPPAPDGWTVLDLEPPDVGASKSAGALRSAGWAWRIRDPASWITFILVESGSFEMGSPDGEEGRDLVVEKQHLVQSAEGPQRTVELTRGFYLAETEVTQLQWIRVMESNPSHFVTPYDVDKPVESVSHEECRAFCRKLGYRLPSEAEWEYCCRAGTATPWNTGADLSSTLANIEFNPAEGTLEVGCFPPNAWGFRDMHGNVWEWCLDSYSEYDPNKPKVDPCVLNARGDLRVIRGGCFRDVNWEARSASRSFAPKSMSANILGFRPVLAIPQ